MVRQNYFQVCTQQNFRSLSKTPSACSFRVTVDGYFIQVSSIRWNSWITED